MDIGKGKTLMRYINSSTVLFILSLFIGNAQAGDFDWLKNLEFEAQADRSGFHYTLSSRFKVGNTQINAVLSNVDRPSDAYMVLRLGEIAHRPVSQVIQVYRTHRKKGWGAMAKKLGIKPGSRAFHALKRGHDLSMTRGSGKGKHHHRGKFDKGKGKGKKH